MRVDDVGLDFSASSVTFQQGMDVMASKLDLQTFTNEFESYWELYSSGLVPHVNKTFGEIIQVEWSFLQFPPLNSPFLFYFPAGGSY